MKMMVSMLALAMMLSGCGLCLRHAWVNGDMMIVDCRVADALPYPSGPVIAPPSRCEVEKSAGRPCLEPAAAAAQK